MALLISCSVPFFLSTMPFDCGVRGAKKLYFKLLESLGFILKKSCPSIPRVVIYYDFMESITIGIRDLDGPGHTKETIRVEYEWKSPRCPTCNIFGHTGKTCPKKVVTNPVVNDNNASNDGFHKIVNRKHNNKGSSAGNKLPKGVPVSKGFQVGRDFAFKPKAPNVGSNGDNGTHDEPKSKTGQSKIINAGESLNTKVTKARQQDMGKKKISNIASPNPFAALEVDDDEEEEVENIWDESKNLNLPHTGASTPAQMVFDV
ncbi:RNA-directed DNA polymerase, eukaryota, reverse transcriptase zinc-binding domain protein [Tanacetum coccineum]